MFRCSGAAGGAGSSRREEAFGGDKAGKAERWRRRQRCSTRRKNLNQQQAKAERARFSEVIRQRTAGGARGSRTANVKRRL